MPVMHFPYFRFPPLFRWKRRIRQKNEGNRKKGGRQRQRLRSMMLTTVGPAAAARLSSQEDNKDEIVHQHVVRTFRGHWEHTEQPGIDAHFVNSRYISGPQDPFPLVE